MNEEELEKEAEEYINIQRNLMIQKGIIQG